MICTKAKVSASVYTRNTLLLGGGHPGVLPLRVVCLQPKDAVFGGILWSWCSATCSTASSPNVLSACAGSPRADNPLTAVFVTAQTANSETHMNVKLSKSHPLLWRLPTDAVYSHGPQQHGERDSPLSFHTFTLSVTPTSRRSAGRSPIKKPAVNAIDLCLKIAERSSELALPALKIAYSPVSLNDEINAVQFGRRSTFSVRRPLRPGALSGLPSRFARSTPPVSRPWCARTPPQPLLNVLQWQVALPDQRGVPPQTLGCQSNVMLPSPAV